MTGKIRTFFILIMIGGLITVATLITIEKFKKDTPPNLKTGGIIVDPKKAVAQMKKKLGPEWEKIEMVQGKWYGPFKIKNGTKWRIATGSIIVRVDNNDSNTYNEFPDSKIILEFGKKVEFFSLQPKTVMFFKL